MKKDRQAVLVTTNTRGVFFGYLVSDQSPERIVLADARNCVYWSIDVKGFLGLASVGPSSSCRIGPKVPEWTCFGITGFARCTSEAIRAWEAAPWSN